MAERFLAKIVFGSCDSGACFTLAVAALLLGCATPVDSGDEEDQEREAKRNSIVFNSFGLTEQSAAWRGFPWV